MTIDSVLQILKGVLRDRTAGHWPEGSVLACHLIDAFADHGGGDRPNEAAVERIRRFEEACADLRRKLVDRDEVGRLAVLAKANGHDRYSVGHCLGTFADDRMIEDIILDTLAGGDSAEWVEECLTDAKYK